MKLKVRKEKSVAERINNWKPKQYIDGDIVDGILREEKIHEYVFQKGWKSYI